MTQQTQTVEISIDALQELADYAADDIRHHGGPELEDLETAVREAYDSLE